MSSQNVDIPALARSINARGLSVPAIFFLELHKPLIGIIREGIQMSKPLAALLFKAASIETVQQLLSSSESVEELINLLEKQ